MQLFRFFLSYSLRQLDYQGLERAPHGTCLTPFMTGLTSLCFPTGSTWNFRNIPDYYLRIRRAFLGGGGSQGSCIAELAM